MARDPLGIDVGRVDGIEARADEAVGSFIEIASSPSSNTFAEHQRRDWQSRLAGCLSM
jgi:hypothetical protein